ncbi:MAG: M56 family metallopeptidase [Dinghuibacter sp.]|nr:M56 family metallopeptidase [Dinghuibacter sp.]
MIAIFEYLFKLSLAFALVWLFYHLVLRKTTFYRWNRIYLLAGSGLCFLLSAINIRPALEQNLPGANHVFELVPPIQQYTHPVHTPAGYGEHIQLWYFLVFVLLSGVFFLLIRLVIRIASLVHVRKRARLVYHDQVSVYHIGENIAPFSYGRSVYLNLDAHSESELRQIILHEFVHIRQKHTLDVLYAELLCILNWYNPFVWLTRKSIRENLEFIADDQVLQAGIKKTEYQFALLRVMGNNQFAFTNNFNFAALKRRIKMMNKKKSQRSHLVRFLLLVPVIIALLLAFRPVTLKTNTDNSEQLTPANVRVNKTNFPHGFSEQEHGNTVIAGNRPDTITPIIKKSKSSKPGTPEKITPPVANKFLPVQTEEPNSPVIAPSPIGSMPTPVEPEAPVLTGSKPETPPEYNSEIKYRPFFYKKRKHENITYSNNEAIVQLKNGSTEKYNLANPEENRKFNRKYRVFINEDSFKDPLFE